MTGPQDVTRDPAGPDAEARVRTALGASGVSYVVLPAYAARLPRLVVAPEDRQQALAALQAAPGLADWRVRLPGREDGRTLPLDRLTSRDTTEVCQLVRPGSRGRADGPPDPRDAVDVEFWRRVPPPGAVGFDGGSLPSGELLAPRPNRTADRLSAARFARSQYAERHWNPAAGAALPHLFEVTDPIDAVYTWVDGEDPAWLARMRQARAADTGRPHHPTALAESRFASRDELRYSLRSLERYAGWVRHVYLVTDGQVPDWLRADHPRLTVVDHSEIFADPGALPVFNSHAIESQLHHIPGLSQRYLYLNDDVFFGRPVAPELFFEGNGQSRFFPSAALIDLDPPGPGDLPAVAAAKRNRQLIQRAFGVTVTQRLKHAPHPQQRRVLDELEQHFASEFDTVMRSRFRQVDDVSVASGLHHYYAYARGLAVPGDLRYAYIDLAHDDAPRRLEALLGAGDKDVFCLNDTLSNAHQLRRGAQLVRGLCERYFPQPSSFERDR